MPSKNEKQRRFMGAELARKRSGKKTQTGMSEQQLSEFAGSVQEHGSLEDISVMEDNATCDVAEEGFVHPLHKGYSYKGDTAGLESMGAITFGALDPPAFDGESVAQFTKGNQSCNRDMGQGINYGAPIYYHGPDTDYRAEEIDPHQYGRSYEPYPLRDYFKTDDKQEERTFRLREQDEYDSFMTPGAVPDSGETHTLAHGAQSVDKISKPNDYEDHRSFEEQRKFARGVTKAPEYLAQTSGIDKKKGKDIR